MIYDQIENAALYYSLHPQFPRAFAALCQTDWAEKPCGHYEIDGDDLFITLAEYQTQSAQADKWEAHQQYIDIQLVIYGSEKMGHAFRKSLEIVHPYDAARDVEFYRGEGQCIAFPKSTFAIYFPHDAHMPGLVNGAMQTVRKAVAKVRIG